MVALKVVGEEVYLAESWAKLMAKQWVVSVVGSSLGSVLGSSLMGWPVGTAVGGTTMAIKVLSTTLTLTEISARDPPARLLALACRPRVKLLSAPTACTSVLNVSKSTDTSLNAGKSTKLQRTTNLNSAGIKLCNFLLLGKAEQVTLDTSIESNGYLFC